MADHRRLPGPLRQRSGSRDGRRGASLLHRRRRLRGPGAVAERRHAGRRAAGTRPLREIVAGDGVPDDFLDTGQVLSLGDHGFFWTPATLWRTDGTAAGTVRVKARQDLLQTAGEDSYAYQLAAWNGDLYSFFSGGEVVRSDGTPAGTVRIAQLPPGDIVARVAAATSGLFFLVIDKQDFPDQIWQTAGTAETTREVLDVFPRYLSGNSFAAAAG